MTQNLPVSDQRRLRELLEVLVDASGSLTSTARVGLVGGVMDTAPPGSRLL